MKRIFGILCLIFILSLCTVPLGAITPIDPDRPSSLTLYYKSSGTGVEGLEVRTYRIAEVYPDGTYALTEDFASYPVSIYDVTSQTEWRYIASTLASYTIADGISPTGVQITDGNGAVYFTDLEPGMYLTLSVKDVTSERIITFETFLTVIPYPHENGNHDYDVEAYPKSQIHTPTQEKIQYKIIKLWQDVGYTENRSESVTVDVYKDNVLAFTQELSAANDWSVSWENENDGSQWHVVEREVPENYAVTLTKRGNTFIITNGYLYEEPDTPGTEDTFVILYYTLLLCAVGTATLVIVTMKKRAEE